MSMRISVLTLAVPLLMAGFATLSALAQETKPQMAPAPVGAPETPVRQAKDNLSRIDIFGGEVAATTDDITTGAIIRESELLGYCLNVADLAVEARGAFLKQELEGIETKVNEKLDELDERIAKLKEWNRKRDEFLSAANDSLVKIYQAMRPDAAALQMAQLGPKMSAAIIAKLEPRVSGIILNEMSPRDAAKITAYLVSALETDDGKK